MLLALVAVWGLRLSGYILIRNWGHGEDYRYQQFREKYGPRGVIRSTADAKTRARSGSPNTCAPPNI